LLFSSSTGLISSNGVLLNYGSAFSHDSFIVIGVSTVVKGLVLTSSVTFWTGYCLSLELLAIAGLDLLELLSFFLLFDE